SLEKQCISKIAEVLELDDSTESKIIAKELIIKGRHTLRDYEQDVTPTVFKKEMSNNQKTITEEWFHAFLQKQTSQSFAIYNKILTRTAEYGSKFMKDNAVLSLILQFLFEFDDKTMEDDNLCNRMWNTMLSEGHQGQPLKDL
ncbi:unnamed protein product, partial [Didymodactylos carnosus]